MRRGDGLELGGGCPRDPFPEVHDGEDGQELEGGTTLSHQGVTEGGMDGGDCTLGGC